VEAQVALEVFSAALADLHPHRIPRKAVLILLLLLLLSSVDLDLVPTFSQLLMAWVPVPLLILLLLIPLLTMRLLLLNPQRRLLLEALEALEVFLADSAAFLEEAPAVWEVFSAVSVVDPEVLEDFPAALEVWVEEAQEDWEVFSVVSVVDRAALVVSSAVALADLEVFSAAVPLQAPAPAAVAALPAVFSAVSGAVSEALEGLVDSEADGPLPTRTMSSVLALLKTSFAELIRTASTVEAI